MYVLNVHSDVTSSRQNRRLVVRIGATITATNAEAIRADVQSAWDEYPHLEAVILDLSEVPQLDSSGVGVLMGFANRTQKAGLPLSLCCLQESPRRLLQRTGIDTLFHIYPTVEGALLDRPLMAGPVWQGAGGQTVHGRGQQPHAAPGPGKN